MDLVYFTLWVIILSFFIFILPALGLHCSVRVSPVAVHGLSCPMAFGILVSRSGIEPVSSALEGGFLTTEPAGMSLIISFFWSNSSSLGLWELFQAGCRALKHLPILLLWALLYCLLL